MFGTLRTTLAFFVVIGHLFGPYQLGTYAVFGFYILSGYLMTTIMHETYGFTLGGRKKYLLNRFLRIYPIYWFAIIISIILLLFIGKEATDYNPIIYLPTSIEGWLKNILIIFSYHSSPRLSPATWALTVEIFFYIAICIGISRSRITTVIWFVISIGYTVFLVSSNTGDWSTRYFPIEAASLPFSIGGMIYHYRDKIQTTYKKYSLDHPLLWLSLVCLNFCISFSVEIKCQVPAIFNYGFYVNLFLMSVLIASLLNKRFLRIGKNTDKRIGNLSYPIYLMHWQVGAFLYVLIFKDYGRGFMTIEGFLFLLSSSILIVFLSLIAVFVIDKPIEKLRTKIKTNKSTSGTSFF